MPKAAAEAVAVANWMREDEWEIGEICYDLISGTVANERGRF